MKESIKLMNRKQVYSRPSDTLITFVDDIDEIDMEGNGVYSDGVTLIDCIDNCEDDIFQMYFVLKNVGVTNCEDFYAEHGAYDKNSDFLEKIEELVSDR